MIGGKGSALDPLKSLFSYPADASEDKESNHLLVPTSSKHVKMRIIPVDGPDLKITTYELLLNPNSITEAKSSNWVKHYVPGYDSPMLQWVNGTERVISFTALVTKDLATNATINKGTAPSDIISFSLNDGSSVVDAYSAYATSEGEILGILLQNDRVALRNELIARQSFKPPVRTPTTLAESIAAVQQSLIPPTVVSDALDNSTKQVFSISIANYLDFYRSLLIPRQSGSSRSSVTSPPLVKLEMGTLLGASQVSKKMRFIMLSYNINVTKMTPDLTPIEAQVGFTFIEYTKANRVVTRTKESNGLITRSGKTATRSNSIEENSEPIPRGPNPEQARGGLRNAS